MMVFLKTAVPGFTTILFRKKRTRILVALALLPWVVVSIVKIVGGLSPSLSLTAAPLFSEFVMTFFVQFFIPLLAVLAGSSLIRDEVEEKTLSSLLCRPVSKGKLFLAKFLSSALFWWAVLLTAVTVSFLIAYFGDYSLFVVTKRFLPALAAALLAYLAYSSLFSFLSTFVPKTVILGIFFIFGWESVVQYFPGSTQKLTVAHYVKSLLPPAPMANSFLLVQLEPSSKLWSLTVLLGLSLLCLLLGAFLFSRKEYNA